MSSVPVADRAVLGTEFGRMSMRQRISEILRVWGCSPETTEQLLLNHDDVGVYINLLDTIRDPKLREKCSEDIAKLRNKAYFMLDRQERLAPSVGWQTTKVLCLIERVIASPALPPELEAVYLA